jgi:SAM-dependent methyltransferase
MDGNPNPKLKKWRGSPVSDARYYINTWLEQELPQLSGQVVNVGSGGSPVPKQLLNPARVTKYTTYDVKYYGDTKNQADVLGSVTKMPTDWTGVWDVALCIEVLECVDDPFTAARELHRMLKPGGTLICTTPYNYRFFGEGTGLPAKQNPVKDYWRFTRDGLELLFRAFSKVQVQGFGGTGEHDRYCYCVKAIK